jgi:hypothetical protein
MPISVEAACCGDDLCADKQGCECCKGGVPPSAGRIVHAITTNIGVVVAVASMLPVLTKLNCNILSMKLSKRSFKNVKRASSHLLEVSDLKQKKSKKSPFGPIGHAQHPDRAYLLPCGKNVSSTTTPSPPPHACSNCVDLVQFEVESRENDTSNF